MHQKEFPFEPCAWATKLTSMPRNKPIVKVIVAMQLDHYLQSSDQSVKCLFHFLYSGPSHQRDQQRASKPSREDLEKELERLKNEVKLLRDLNCEDLEKENKKLRKEVMMLRKQNYDYQSEVISTVKGLGKNASSRNRVILFSIT